MGPDEPGWAREKGLWELYAYNPPSMFMDKVFLFDAQFVFKELQVRPRLGRGGTAPRKRYVLVSFPFFFLRSFPPFFPPFIVRLCSTSPSLRASPPVAFRVQGVPVGLFGNFNGWSVPIPMTQISPSSTIFRHVISVRSVCLLVCSFYVRERVGGRMHQNSRALIHACSSHIACRELLARCMLSRTRLQP